MKTTGVGFVLLLLMLSFFISCRKNKASRTDLLVEKTWRFIKSEEKLNSGTYVDSFAGLPDCEKDNLLDFMLNYTYKHTEGATKCSPGDPDVIAAGIWDLEQGDTHLVIGTDDYMIEQLNENILVISGFDIAAADTFHYRRTLVH
jgi:hypothetical protein